MLKKLIDKYIAVIVAMLGSDDVSATKIVSLTKELRELIKLQERLDK